MKIIFSANFSNIPSINKPGLIQNSIKFQNKDKFEPSFRGEQFETGFYTDNEIELARKYKYAKNYDTHLRNDIWNSFSGWDRLFGNYLNDTQFTFDEVKKLIKELHENDKKSSSQISSLESKISTTVNNIKLKEKEQKDLEVKIKEQKAKNKEQQKEIKKIEIEQKRISYLKDNINNALILPLKAEQEQGRKYIALNSLNGIMVSNASTLMMNSLVNSIKHNSNCEIEKINFEDLKEKEVINRLREISQKAAQKNCRTLIYIENFEKYTVNKAENETIIGKLKNFLQCCSAKYNCIVFTNVDNPKQLSTEINADHRFKIHLDTKNVKENNIMECIQVLDGYNLKFGEDDGESVNLFIGDSGYNPEILWIDSSDNEKIDAVIENLDKIKKIDKFKNINRVECPIPDLKDKTESFRKLENRYTYDNKPIYQMII